MGSVKISQYTGDLSADSGSFNHITVTGNIQGGLPSGLISSSTQIDTDFFDIDGLVSSSTQIDDLGFLKVSGDSVLSSSAQVVSSLPVGTVSGSAQVDYRFISNVVSGIVSSSDQILPIATSSITDFNTEVSRSAADAGFGSGGGGFTPSLSTDITARNITASGDISASAIFLGATSQSNAGKTPFVDFTGSGGIGGYGEYQIGVADNAFLGPSYSLNMKGYHINLESAYGLMSASAPDVLIQSQYTGYDNNEIRLGYLSGITISSANDLSITGDTVDITGPITASGAISASGDLYAKDLYLYNNQFTSFFNGVAASPSISNTFAIGNQGGGSLYTTKTLAEEFRVISDPVTATHKKALSWSSGLVIGDYGANITKINGSGIQLTGNADMSLTTVAQGDITISAADDFSITADTVDITGPITASGAISASGFISAFGSSSLSGLPTTEPNVTGALWISGSSEAHPNSGYLMVFNP